MLTRAVPASSRPATAAAGVGGHIPALDGLRGVAILLVLLYHAKLDLSDGPVDRFVMVFTSSGWSGVDLFFVLSGFLITGILYDAKVGKGYFRNFYARRFLRIFPLYYAVLVMLLLVVPRLPFVADRFEAPAGDTIWYWLYLCNFSLALQHAEAPRRLDVFWSLAIEEQFYAAWPVIVLMFSRSRLLRLCAIVVCLSLGFRTILTLSGVHPQTIYALTPGRLDGLAIGAAIALLLRDRSADRGLIRWAGRVALGAVAGLLGIAMTEGGLHSETPAMQTVGLTLLALFFGATLVLAVTSDPSSKLVRALHNPMLRFFGKYSYAIYLFHVPLTLMLLASIFRPSEFPLLAGSVLPAQLTFLAMVAGISFAAAWLSWHLFERHFLALKRFFEYERVRASSEPHVPAVGPEAVGGALVERATVTVS